MPSIEQILEEAVRRVVVAELERLLGPVVRRLNDLGQSAPAQPPQGEGYLTPAEAAKYARVGRRALREAVKEGLLPERWQGRGRVFLRADLDHWLATNRRAKNDPSDDARINDEVSRILGGR